MASTLQTGEQDHERGIPPIELVRGRLDGFKQTAPNQWIACCPAHSDSHPSLGVSVGEDGRLLLKCRSQGCSAEQICKALGLTISDLFPPESDQPKKRIVATYDYTDEAGCLLYQVVRYDPKDFRQRRRGRNGEWDYSVQGIRRVLYRLPDIVNALMETPVWIVEGEKDVETLRKLGLLATTNAGGAGKWRGEFNEVLRDRPVLLLPDNDDAGHKHAQKVATALHGIAASVRVIELPGLPDKGDVSDWIAQPGNDKETLLKLAEAAVRSEEASSCHSEQAQHAGQNPSNNTSSVGSLPNTAAEPWQVPTPLSEDIIVPDFPLQILPPWLRNWVEAEALATQTPPDLAGLLSLATIGAGMATKYRVIIRDGWSEPTNIFVVNALPPGERKSVVFRDVMAPVQEFEKEEIKRMEPVIAEAASVHRTLEARLKHIENKAVKEEDALERDKFKQDAKQVAKDLAEHDVPDVPQCFCDDVTPEKLANLLARQGGRMLLASAEGTAFEIAKGRYSDTANFDVFLKRHSGDPLRTDRITRSGEKVERPALSCALAVQPDVIRGLADQNSMKGRGFLARWCYSVPRSHVGSRSIAPPAVPEVVAQEFQRLMMMVWRLQGTTDQKGQPAPHWLRFSAAAESIFQEFEKWLEPQLADGEELSYLAGWANKLAGLVARIAAILHVAEAVGNEALGSLDPISQTTVKAAICLGKDYLLPHAQAAFGLMGGDPRLEVAHAVLGWIARHFEGCGSSECSEYAPLSVSRRDIHQGCRRKFQTVDDVDPIIEILVKYGWLRPYGDGKPGRGGNQSPQYHVNPAILELAQKEATRTHCTHCTQSEAA